MKSLISELGMPRAALFKPPVPATMWREFLSVPPTFVFVMKWFVDSAELRMLRCCRFFRLSDPLALSMLLD